MVDPPQPIPGPKSRDIAAKLVGSTGTAVGQAKLLKREAPALFERVKSGAASLPQAKAQHRRDEKRTALNTAAAVAASQPKNQSAPSCEVITGDCVDELAKLEAGSVNLVFADPPYNIGLSYGAGHDDAMPLTDYYAWCHQWIKSCSDALSPTGSMWLLINHERAARLELAIAAAGLTIRSWVTWYETFGVNCSHGFNRTSRRLFHCVVNPKAFTFNLDAIKCESARQRMGDKRANPDGKNLDDVWLDIPRLVGNSGERLDGQTQLPVELLTRIVACSSNPGDLVVDPFSGSGTTGAAAISLRRRFVGIEANSERADLARKRLAIASRD